MKLNKIRINKISRAVLKKKGFDHRGCYGSSCNDACCRYGCNTDRESYELIIRHRKAIETRLGVSIEDCFKGKWSDDSEFLGGNSIDTTTIKGFCAFKLPDEKGCILYELAMRKKASKRIIPSICRLYPLTWGGGELMMSDCEFDCNCLEKNNKSPHSILQTQKDHIRDIFVMEGKAKAGSF